MSRAEPLKMGDRARNYVLAGASGRHFTPRQWRRLRHKHNKLKGAYYGHWGDIAKGDPTPRQRKPAHRG